MQAHTETKLDRTLFAMADPTRRAIVRQLCAGEARVTEVARPHHMSLNAVSKHIRILERAGLVRRRRVGRDHFLTFDPEPLSEAREWIDRMRSFWNARLDALESLLKSDTSHTNQNRERKRKR